MVILPYRLCTRIAARVIPISVHFRPSQASRQGWPRRRSLQAAAGHPWRLACLALARA